MFAIGEEVLKPIHEMLFKIEPDADTTKMGSWGILYLCCGAIAGQSLYWKVAVFENLRMPTARELLDINTTGTKPEEGYALDFKECILEWTYYDAAINRAKKQLDVMLKSRPANEELFQSYQMWVALAFMLNSLKDSDVDYFKNVRVWADSSSGRWPILFFAAGLLLSSDEKYRWERLGTAIISSNGNMKEEIKALFKSFESNR
jgi:hypothetical protein